MSQLVKYRPEVDGLRGIAVILVIIFHARFLTEEGFFLEGAIFSVDMFYVISGYLMTTIILNQINRDGYLSYNIFVESRIRRIWPTYFFFLIICMFVFWIGPTETILSVKQFMQNIFAATLFQSNHFFPYRIIEYSAVSSLYMPLLHTWTLSVEVQFYILFPFLILLIINFFKKNFLLVFFTLAIISLILAEIMTRNYPVFSFYLFPTRIFELMTGAMVSIIERNKNYNFILDSYEKEKRFFKKISNYGSLLGATLLIFTFLVFDEKTRHPSMYTIIPVIGTGLLILFSKDNFMKKILSNKLIVGIGLISYSLYLFHYPIFAFPRAIQAIDEYNNVIKILLIFLSIIIAIVSYFLIEKTFRNKKFLKRKTVYALTFLSASFLLISSTYLHYNYKPDPNVPKFILENRDVSSWKDVRDGLGYCYGRTKNYCAWDWVGSKNTKLYVVGDSHMSTLEKGILEFQESRGSDIPLKLITGRFYLPDFKKIDDITKKEIEFLEPVNKVKKILTVENESGVQAGGQIVIYGGYFSHHLNEDIYVQSGRSIKKNDFFQPSNKKNLVTDKFERKKLILAGIKKSIEEILEKHTMIIVYPIPEAGALVAQKLFNKYQLLSYFNTTPFESFIKKNKFYITTPYQNYLDRNKEILNLLDSIEHPNLYKVFPAKHFCNNEIKNRCITHDDKAIYYHDRHHLSPKGAEFVNEDIIKILKKLYKKD